MDLRTKQSLEIFWQHSKKYKLHIFLIVLGLVGVTFFDTYVPFLYKLFFDNLAAGGASAAPALFRVIWYVLLANFGLWVCWRLAGFVNNYYQPRVMSDLLNTCFSYLHRHSYAYFSNSFAGSLVRKVGRYPRSFEDIADQIFFNIGLTLFRVIVILAVLFVRNYTLGFIVFAWAIIFIYFNYRFALYKQKFDEQRAALETKTTALLADTISNNINLKLFAGAHREEKSFFGLTEELFRTKKFGWDLGQLSETIQGALIVVVEFGVMYAAVKLWQRGILTIGDFALIQAYLISLFNQLFNFGRFIRRVHESVADANEMTEILKTPHEVVDQPGAKKLQVSSGKIDFIDVSFSYGKHKRIFDNFGLAVQPGERVALIGPSGGGKTTIVKLLLRFMDISGGSILIDGQNITAVTQDSLHQNIAVVPQEPILFHRTLMENIRYARPQATDKEVIAAAKLAHCHEFISEFPDKYQTFVGERGIKLSGGERQRVAIARAILKNAPILVLDEATSSLDSESERLIQDALHKLMQGKTTIVIAHRLSTIMQMDRIIVLENGRLSEQGKHEELLKMKRGTYQKLWGIQAGGFK